MKPTINMQEFTRTYLKRLTELLETIDPAKIESFFEILEEARLKDKNIFFIGNGGSASTASHFASDFLGANIKKDLLLPYKAQSLCDNQAVITAFGNDFGYDDVFSLQLKTLFNERDVLVSISASGNSPNIIKAIDWVNENNGITVGLVGFDGGELLKRSQLCIHCASQKGEYGPVEDIHLVIDHLINNYILNYIS